ncbi:DUF2167 domain-containing protein [Methylocystis heyeri]|nr:DUF2167 domain-containing protein [Methylocystis heyeri]
MSFDRPRVARKFVSASLLAALGAAVGSPAVEARELGNKRELSNVEIQRPQRRVHDDVIFEMEPLHPWQGATIGSQAPAAKAAKPAPAQAGRPETAAKEGPRGAEAAKAPSGIDAKGGETAKESAQSTPKPTAPEPASEEANGAAPASTAAQPSQAVQTQGGVPAAGEQGQAAPAVATSPEAVGAQAPVQSAQPVPASASQTAASPEAAAPAQPKAPEASAQAKAPEKQGEPAKAQAPGVAQPAQAPAPAQGAAPAVAAKEEVAPAGAKEQAPAAPQAVSSEPNPDEEAKAYAAMLAQGLKGPTEVRIADRATMWLPAGRVFLEGEQARKLLGIDPASWDDATLGVVLPVASGPKWIAYVDLMSDGYIKDDEGKSLDAGNLLAAYKSEVDSQNPGRARLGLTPLEVTGWLTEPSYDAKHHLSSCIGATAQGSKNPDDSIVNCTSFALGRDGAVKVVVSGDEAGFAQFKGEAPALVDTIVFDKGKGYEDADLSMDRVAGYGLSALVTGAVALKKLTGAAAAATTVKKVGLFSLIAAKIFKAWKLLLAGAALLAAGARLIARKRQGAPETEVVETESEKTASAPIWSRIAEGLRARFSRSAPEAADGGAVAEPQASQPAAEPSEGEGGGSLLGSLRAKLAALPFFNRAKAESEEPEPAAAGAVVSETLPAEEKSHGSILSKLASMMRRQGRQPAGEADAAAGEAAGSQEAGGQSAAASGLKKFASLMRKQAQGGRVAADVLRAAGDHARAMEVATPGGSAAKSPAVSAAQADGAGQAAAEASADDFVDLVEPGDEAAASAAISAREALRKARA